MSIWSWLAFKRRVRAAALGPTPGVSVLSPEEFVRLYRAQLDAVETAMIVPPRLGSPGFGKIVAVTKPVADVRSYAVYGRFSLAGEPTVGNSISVKTKKKAPEFVGR